MTPPPIRYPLPTLILAIALGLAAWWGAELTGSLRAALAARWERAVKGPDVPRSDRPRAVAGAMVRRVLLLRDDVPASDRPGGPVTTTIRMRMFADVYDVWPLAGRPTHLRIGNNRRPIGWIDAADALAWDTRLVVRAPSGRLALADSPDGPPGAPSAVGEAPLPVVAWRPGMVQVAAWKPDRPWSDVARLGWARAADLPAGAWGVWLSRDELLILLRRATTGDDPAALRLSAVLGRLAGGDPGSAEDRAAARQALPAVAFAGQGGSARTRGEALARINEEWTPDASWAGLSFRSIPLADLP